jgi:Raf kinase inhibitor-like YbhB/YbcL family protein
MRLALFLSLSLLICLSVGLALVGCTREQEKGEDLARRQGEQIKPEAASGREAEEGVREMAFKLTSSAFEHGKEIPGKFTCLGQDVSPTLSWENPPDGTRSFALICDDPDAPGVTWVHWVVWAIPPTTTGFSEAIPPNPVLDDGTTQGITDFGKAGYGGPCPPPGKPHRYFFKLYALDNITELEPRAIKKQLLEAMEGHILGQAELMGTFGR